MDEEDLQLRIALDDPWNIQECDAFNRQKLDQTGKYSFRKPDPETEQRDNRGDAEQDHALC